MDPRGQMSRSLQDLAAALKQSREGPLPDVQAFPPVDREEIASELKLYVRAAAAGQQNMPPSDAAAPDAAEKDVGTAIERYARQAGDTYRSQLKLCDDRITRASLTDAERVEIEAACEGALADLEGRVGEHVDQLSVVWRDTLEDVETEFQEFRIRHGLTRLPKVVSTGQKLLRNALLVVFVVLGTVLNGRFLVEGSGAGLIGWIAPALVLSVLNIGAAVWYAQFGLPRLFGHGFGSKLTGVMSTGVFLGWTLATNLLCAHFRDVFIANHGEVTIPELSRRLALAPFGVDDPKSWLLALLGLGLSVLSAFDAAGRDDLHPGYGALGRRRVAAVEAFRAEASSYLDGLTSIRDAAVRDIGAAIETIRSLEYAAQLAIDARSRIHRELVAHLDHLASVHEQLCMRYREVNEHVRTRPAPKYFKLLVPRPACLEDPPHPVRKRPPQEAWSKVIERMEDCIRRVNSAFSEALPRYEVAEESVADAVEEEVTV